MIRGQNLNFLLYRLKNASFPELLYRSKEALFIFRCRTKFRKGTLKVQAPTIDKSSIAALQLPHFEFKADKHILDSVLKGKVFTLTGSREEIEQFEREWRGVFFAEVLNARSAPDIRMVWELARLQHLTILLQYMYRRQRQSGVEQIQELVKKAILEWRNNNPFLSGPHYLSAMECGLRIPVFFYSLKVLKNLADNDQNLILETIYQHAWWIERRLSLYSSLGNHTIAECTGLLFAGAIFGSAPQGRRWLERATALLKNELSHQILKDGGPGEQSFNYLRFILDLYWLATDFLEKNRLYDCQEFKAQLHLGESFLKAFRNNQGILPQIGDSDDGYAVAPGIFPKKSEEHEARPYRSFSTAGYTVIRGDSGLIFTFDHGPLGMPPLYNHGHADALSVTLSLNAKFLLVDPGTYRYNGVPEYRRYFKGTRAHNTVTVDGEDQAVQETGFIWSRPFKASLVRALESEDGFILEGRHDGYCRLKNPVTHHRTVSFWGGGNFLIRDTFSGKGTHRFELNYHLHPDAEATPVDAWWVIEKAGERIFMQLLNRDRLTLIAGQEDPPFGWFSPNYGIKRESGVLTCSKKTEARDASFLTAICAHAPVNHDVLKEKAELM